VNESAQPVTTDHNSDCEMGRSPDHWRAKLESAMRPYRVVVPRELRHNPVGGQKSIQLAWHGPSLLETTRVNGPLVT